MEASGDSIFDMTQKNKITGFALQSFKSVLEQEGYDKVIISDEGWITRISFLSNFGLAVEVELDWRDFAFFIFLVRLDGKRLPEGYYVNKGKKCRIHIQAWAKAASFDKLLPPPLPQRPTEEQFLICLRKHGEALLKIVKEVKNSKKDIFGES